MTTAAPPPTSPQNSLSDDAELDRGSEELDPRWPRPRRSFGQQFAYWIRWLHIYLSLLSFTVLLFFAVTGLTVNHPDWFGASSVQTTTAEGTLPAGLVPAGGGEASIDKLALVEFLRSNHAIRGALAELRADETECTVAFKGPGYAADFTIDRASSHYDLHESRYGLVAVFNDLHKGRDTGQAWSVLIDASAVAMTVVSLSGLVLLFYLKRRLLPGLITAVVGMVLIVVVYAMFVS